MTRAWLFTGTLCVLFGAAACAGVEPIGGDASAEMPGADAAAEDGGAADDSAIADGASSTADASTDGSPPDPLAPACEWDLVTTFPSLEPPAHNESSALTWGTSYVMMGYMAKVRADAAKDPARFDVIAREFIAVADAVMAARDDVRGYAHELPVWSSTDYTDGVPYATVVSTGMIGYPIAAFAALMAERPDLAARAGCDTRTFGEIADGYTAALIESVRAHHHEWNAATGSYRANAYSASFFEDSSGRSMSGFAELPYNQSIAMGRMVLMLYVVTGDPWLRLMAHNLATRVHASMHYDAGGLAYVWPYWSIDSAKLDDITHGAIVVDFAALCHDRGIVFDGDDMVALARTFSENVYRGGSELAFFVDGSATLRNRNRDWAFLWLPLARFEPQVKNVVLQVRRLAPPTAGGTPDIAGALYLEELGGRLGHGESCATDADCQSSVCRTGVCANHVLGNSSACERNYECFSGYCAEDAVCRNSPPFAYPGARNLADGSACTQHMECRSKVCLAAPATCGRLQPVGEACAGIDEAITGLCEDGLVLAR